MRHQADGVDHPADALRDEPLGEDAKGNLYYFFSTAGEDCWLYRMEPPRKRQPKKQWPAGGDEGRWEPVCTTLEELEQLIARLSASRNRDERHLHDELVEDIQPMLLETAGARRKAEERAAALEAVPKKRSSRLQARLLQAACLCTWRTAGAVRTKVKRCGERRSQRCRSLWSGLLGRLSLSVLTLCPGATAGRGWPTVFGCKRLVTRNRTRWQADVNALAAALTSVCAGAGAEEGGGGEAAPRGGCRARAPCSGAGAPAQGPRARGTAQGAAG